MKKHYAVILILSLLTAHAVRATEPDYSDAPINLFDGKYAMFTELADSLYKCGEITKAIEATDSALRVSPANPLNAMLQVNAAAMLVETDRPLEALARLDIAHNIVPTSTTVLQRRAEILMSLDRNEEALSDLSLLLEIDSCLIEPRLKRGMLSLYNGNYEQAKSDFDTLNRLAPDNIATATGYAVYYLQTDELAQAKQWLSIIIDAEPDADYYSMRAYCNLQLNLLPEAGQDIASAMKLNPNDPFLYLYRARLNKLLYQYDKARADAKTAMTMGVDREVIKKFLE
ncbi:MAG: tetratricopeptide repeat protein [Paramuribaculum sp.]|nr:tetratricopeptide repeat protein [Paramuribaculum sp.]